MTNVSIQNEENIQMHKYDFSPKLKSARTMISFPPSNICPSQELMPSKEKSSRHVEGSWTHLFFVPNEVILEVSGNRQLACNPHSPYEDCRGQAWDAF